MVDGQVMPAVLVQLVVCSPAVGDDCGVLVDVPLDNVNQCRSISFVLRTDRQKDIARFASNSPNHPLAFH